MASSPDRIKEALDETRMLILGAEVLLAVQYESVFEHNFARLPAISRFTTLAGLSLMLIAILLLMAPVAYDRVMPEDAPGEDRVRFVRRMVAPALLPFAISLGIDLYIATRIVSGPVAAAAVACAGCLGALFFWYGLEFLNQRKQNVRGVVEMIIKSSKNGEKHDPHKTPVAERINHILTEARVVIPGAQAMLGFQVLVMLSQPFEKLPASSKYVHLTSLGLMALTIILLMTPAAYHRIVNQGEDTEDFCQLASHMVLSAMIPLALGLCTDFYVVASTICRSSVIAAAMAGVLLTAFYGLWFGYTFFLRSRQQSPELIIAQ